MDSQSLTIVCTKSTVVSVHFIAIWRRHSLVLVTRFLAVYSAFILLFHWGLFRFCGLFPGNKIFEFFFSLYFVFSGRVFHFTCHENPVIARFFRFMWIHLGLGYNFALSSKRCSTYVRRSWSLSQCKTSGSFWNEGGGGGGLKAYPIGL